MAVEVTKSADVAPTPHRFTVDDYYRMAEVGILGPEDRVQLVDGVVIDMPPMGPDHADSVDDMDDYYSEKFAGRAHVRAQLPIHLPDGSEPEPDLVLVRLHPGVRRPYRNAHPTADDTLLVIEVADSTLAFDLGSKARMYAQHGILDLWVLDIRGERLVVHREPSPEGYGAIVELRRGDTIAPLAFPDTLLTLDEILGEP
jgi:Uma2 family endonuclease